MNRDMAQGEWKQMSGKIKQKWGKLTDDDLTRAQGDRDYLVGKLHEQYGIARDQLEGDLNTLGYSEDDQDADLRSSDRSSAGRMDLAGKSGSKMEAGFANAGGTGSQQGGNPDREDPSGRSSSVEGDDLSEGRSQLRGGPQQPGGAGHTLEAGSAQDKSPQRSQPGQSGNSSKQSPGSSPSQSQSSGKGGQQSGPSGQGSSKR